MERNSLFSNNFKSVELCKQMQKKCSIESTILKSDEIDYDDSIDENEIYSVDEYDEQKNDNDSNASSRLSLNYLKCEPHHPLTELNPFFKNKHCNEFDLNNRPLTPAGICYEFSNFLNTFLNSFQKKVLNLVF